MIYDSAYAVTDMRADTRSMKTIRELRDERGWSRLALAGHVGVDPMTIAKWEWGIHVPSLRQARAIAAALGVSMDDIDYERPYEAKHDDSAKPQD